MTPADSAENPAALLRQLDRERRARAQAEHAAESRMRELIELNASLDRRVEERTEELATSLEAAAAAATAKRSFLAHMGDALETPMHGILGNLELLDVDAMSTDDAARLATVHAAANELAAIIGGLMELAASEGRPFEPMMEADTPDRFLERLEHHWQRRLAAKGQLLLAEAEGDGTEEITADWNRLQRVADLVLDNVRAHAGPGRVSVNLRHVDGLLTLVTSDAGPGIPVEHWEEVLAPFFRLDQDPGSPKAGTGIGLAVALRLLESVGGSIRIGLQGEGTSVVATMPAERRTRQRTPIVG